MKCVAVGDIYITPDMMRKGIEGYSGLTFDRVDYFYFGLDTRPEMRHVVKVSETGGFETLDLPEGLLDAVADAVLRILAAKVAKPGCLLVCESGSPDLLAKLGDAADKFDVQKEARYGITHITLLRYKGEEDEEGEKT